MKGTARGSRVAIPWGLLGMLVLVLLGERQVARHGIDLLDPSHWDWRNTGAAAKSNEVTSSNLLYFGDSLVKLGVLPTVIERLTGRSGFNLSMAGGQTSSSYFLFRRALRAGARPSAVLIDTFPPLLARNPTKPRELRLWSELLRPGELIDFAWTTRDPLIFAELACAIASPTIRCRFELRKAACEALRGEPSTTRFKSPQFWRNARLNRGSCIMPRGGGIGDAAEAFNRLYPKRTLVVDPVNLRYFERFLALAEERGILVLWLLTPVTHAFQSLCDQSGFDADHTEFVWRMRTRHPNLVVIDGRSLRLHDDRFAFDPFHLNRDGALALSASLAPGIAKAISRERGDRWVFLTPGRAGTTDEPIEDIFESALAMKRQGVRR